MTTTKVETTEVVVEVTQEDTPEEPSGFGLDTKKMTKKQLDVCKAVLLSICYSVNMGGSSTLTGNGPNVVFRAQLER